MDNNSKCKRNFYNVQDASNVAMMGILTPIIMSFVVSILYMIIGGIAGQDPEVLLKTAPWVYFANLIVEFGFVIVYMLYNKHSGINAVNATNFKQKTSVWVYVIAIVLGLVLPFCFNGIIGLWSAGLDSIGYKLSELSVPMASMGDLVLAIVVVAIVPAICEELLFRGIVLNGLRSKGKWVAVLISAMMFSLMHNNIEQLPYTFILGVVLGYIVYETGSIIPSMLIHVGNNAMVLLGMYMQQNAICDFSIAITNIAILDIIIWALIGVAIVIGVFFIVTKLNKENRNNQSQIAEYYDNKFIMRDGQQVQMLQYIDKQSKKTFKYAIIIGVCLLILSIITHFGS